VILIEFVMMISWDVSAVVVIGREAKLGALYANELANRQL
jgi:hypothetical protein